MQVHQEEIILDATPEQVREFVLTPERMMDYYPGGISSAVIEPGESYYCHGKAGVSLVERVSRECTSTKVVLRVTTARGVTAPISAEKIRKQAFFTMIEDWETYPAGTGTRLVKSWRDIDKKKLRWLPLAFIVRQTAKSETDKLKQAWNEAAAI